MPFQNLKAPTYIMNVLIYCKNILFIWINILLLLLLFWMDLIDPEGRRKGKKIDRPSDANL